MSIEFDDDELREVFAEYRGSHGPKVRSAGAVAASRQGLARRRRRYTFLSAVAIVGLLAPAAAFALTTGGGAPIGGDLPRPERSGGMPKGGLTKPQLLASSVAMPVFEGDTTGTCPHGEVGLADDRIDLHKWPSNDEFMTYTDIDRDGSFETVLHARCVKGDQLVAEQILVVAPGSGANLQLRGRVVGTGGEISAVGELRPQPNGAIRVLVAGPRTCCQGLRTGAERQWREYAWNGRGFTQSGGSVAFGQQPGNLVVSLPEVHLLRSGAGNAQLKITNVGSQAVDSVLLTVVARGVRINGPAWSLRAPGTEPGTVEFTRTIGELGPGDVFTTDVELQATGVEAQMCSLSVMAEGNIGKGELTNVMADIQPQDNEDIEVVLRFE